jgi:hypothetical protein
MNNYLGATDENYTFKSSEEAEMRLNLANSRSYD